jgi:hypothetical protein
MRTVRVTYEVITIRNSFRWTNAEGKRRSKSVKFQQSINPFNKNPDGTVKTRQQIWAELQAESGCWHQACKAAGRGLETFEVI